MTSTSIPRRQQQNSNKLETTYETRPHRSINILLAVIGLVLSITFVYQLWKTGKEQLVPRAPLPQPFLISQSAFLPRSAETLDAWMVLDKSIQQILACEIRVVTQEHWMDVYVWTAELSSAFSFTRYSGFLRQDSSNGNNNNNHEWVCVSCGPHPPLERRMGERRMGEAPTLVHLVQTVLFHPNQTALLDSIQWTPVQEQKLLSVASFASFLVNASVPAPHVCNRDPLSKLRVTSLDELHPELRQRQFHAEAKVARVHQRLQSQKLAVFEEAGVQECRREMIGNGKCDAVCNFAQFKWDGGDCCIQLSDLDELNELDLENLRTRDCRAGPKVLLLHGASVGIRNSANLNTQFSDVSPQADIETKLGSFGLLPSLLKSAASQVILNAHNTRDVGWDNAELQKAYYDKAQQVYEDGGVVFAHSFANLVLAGACLDQGLCEVQWHAVGAPWRGSRVLGLSYPIRGVDVDLNNTGVQSMRPNFRGLFEGTLTRIVAAHHLLLGGVCGASAYGSGGPLGSEFSALSTLSTRQPPWHILTDGITAVAECALDGDDVLTRQTLPINLWEPILDPSIDWQHVVPLAAFQADNTTSPFVILEANHRDLAGSPSSGAQSSASRRRFQPILKWYLSRVLF